MVIGFRSDLRGIYELGHRVVHGTDKEFFGAGLRGFSSILK
jgi:hypothetical protein